MISAECHLTLSLEGALSDDSPNNMCMEYHLTQNPLGLLSYDSSNNICVEYYKNFRRSKVSLILASTIP